MSVIDPPLRSIGEDLLETFDGDAAFVDGLVASFLKRCPILLEEIRAALVAGDIAAASRSAHSLKGTIGYFETGNARAAAQQIEDMTQADLPRAPALLLALEQSAGDVTRHLWHEFPGGTERQPEET